MLGRILGAAIGVLIVIGVTNRADAVVTPPPWFDPTVFDFSFSGSIGGSDIDRVTPFHHAVLGGLEPGRDWFAWVDASAPGVILTSWQDYNIPPTDTFVGFIARDEFSSPLSAVSPALLGEVQPDGGIYICVSGQNDPDCVKQSGSPFRTYSFFIAYEPPTENGGSIPEPGTLALFGLAIGGIGFIAAWCRRRPVVHDAETGDR